MDGRARPRGLPCAVTMLVAVIGLGACGGHDVQAGFGLPTQPPDEPFVGDRTALAGTFWVEDNGCFTLELDPGTAGQEDHPRRWVVWPSDAEHAGDRVRLAGGSELLDGARVTGTGAVVALGTLPGWSDPSSYYGSFGRFCTTGVDQVVVLDAVARE
ncbi:hypothetical protein [Actinotalea sp. K2]|uniref:hypothetical protein n=1 Tax=Actinotalea sp. K2 TaxID=2939438 RepID=UPI0020180048|nr:hypothetical protein [Actinotalea sp. K2]MCL3863046.1 hypothetical protein [Actinotalea sp. K2]